MMRFIKFTIVAVLFFILLSGKAVSQDTSNQDHFWSALKKLCGKAYAGNVVASPDSDTTFKGKKLMMDVYSCQESKIKITFIVGSDRSRTWIFYQSGERLLLKHEHRLQNGALDRVTNYGGWTSNQGSAERQVFPADQETAVIVPEAATNVWWINLVTGKDFTYNMQRLGTDRYYALKFDLSKGIPVPELLDK